MAHQAVPHIFLAAPYTQWMDAAAGMVRQDRMEYVMVLRDALLQDGAAVFSAHQNEDWGRGWLPPEICTPADYLAVKRADVVCAILGSPPSAGVLVELGWASALQKPTVLLVDSDPPQLVRGLGEVTRLATIAIAPAWEDATLAAVVDAVRGAIIGHSPTSVAVAGYPETSLPFGYHKAPARRAA
jgi:nucleoside 2-deoxyribosyltransferase